MPFLHSEGATVHYVATKGAGPLANEDRPWIVLSNSLGTNLSMWDAQMESFSADFNVLRYDSRGHGQSAFSGAFTMADLGNDVLALMDELGIAKAFFCGLSLGGMVGQWVAIHAPERFTAAALCCTAAKIGTVTTWNDRIATVTRDGLGSLVPSILERWYTPGFRARAAEQVDRTREMLKATNSSAYAATCAAIRDADFTNDVSSIRMPTLLVCGEHDPVTPPSDAEWLAARIAGAKVQPLNAAHLANIEDARAFSSSVAAFFLQQMKGCERDA